ncbi:hypothetical protein MN608_08964 [Microdochium nivale]|nr:hypothetical protein MN608_08964 [Microdochium nivale]
MVDVVRARSKGWLIPAPIILREDFCQSSSRGGVGAICILGPRGQGRRTNDAASCSDPLRFASLHCVAENLVLLLCELTTTTTPACCQSSVPPPSLSLYLYLYLAELSAS